jgi:hypothetical protein
MMNPERMEIVGKVIDALPLRNVERKHDRRERRKQRKESESGRWWVNDERKLKRVPLFLIAEWLCGTHTPFCAPWFAHAFD